MTRSMQYGARGSVVGLRTMLQAGRSRDQVPMKWIFSIYLTTALGSTRPLTEASTRNLPGVKGPPARRTDNLTAICEPII
jgi:hypothetical protein